GTQLPLRVDHLVTARLQPFRRVGAHLVDEHIEHALIQTRGCDSYRLTQPRPIAFSIDGGIDWSPRASIAARSTLITSCSRSVQPSHGPGGIAPTSPRASTHARR